MHLLINKIIRLYKIALGKKIPNLMSRKYRYLVSITTVYRNLEWWFIGFNILSF